MRGLQDVAVVAAELDEEEEEHAGGGAHGGRRHRWLLGSITRRACADYSEIRELSGSLPKPRSCPLLAWQDRCRFLSPDVPICTHNFVYHGVTFYK
jgi:hypothetical protein